MKHQELSAATESLVASVVAQMHALFPFALSATVRSDTETWVRKAFKEARRLHPGSPSQQAAHAQQRADDAIRMNLANIGGTMH